MKTNLKCPVCNHQLQKKYEGMACVNWKCKLYFKLGRGWILLTKEKEDSMLFWTCKYNFDITRHENIKKWLRLKSEIIYDRKCCEVCKSNRFLHIHHIMPRSSNPELALDKDNLMVLCEDCHREIHKNDKYSFSRKKVIK